MMATRSLTFLQALALSLLLRPSLCSCPLSGCTSSRSFSSPTAFHSPPAPPPRHVSPPPGLDLLWTYTQHRPAGDGCSTNGGRVACPLALGQNGSLVSLSVEDPALSSWLAPPSPSPFTLPLMDLDGAIIATDGHTLAGYYADGTPQGKPVQLYPVNGATFDLSIASEQVVIILYRCGFIATFLTNGVPHAGLWLNDTVNGTSGTFIPLGNPTVNESRMYIMTAFRPHSVSPAGPASFLLSFARLFAIDIRRTISERIQIVWSKDVRLGDSELPYLNEKRTFCSSLSSYVAKPSSVNLSRPPSLVMTQGETVVTSTNLCKTSECNDTVFKLQAIKDLGSGYKVLYEEDGAGGVVSMAWREVLGTVNNATQFFRKDNKIAQPCYWLLVSDGEESYLQERLTEGGDIVRQVALKAVMGTQERVGPTAQMTLVFDDQTTIGLVAVRTEIGSGHTSTVSSPLYYILTLDLSDDQAIKLLGQTLLPNGEPVLGQIAVEDTDTEGVVVVSTSRAINGYRLATQPALFRVGASV